MEAGGQRNFGTKLGATYSGVSPDRRCYQNRST